MGGMVFAVIAIPNMITFAKRVFMKNEEWATFLLERQSKYDSKKLRKTKVFKTRLKAILDTIEEAATRDKKNRIVITNMSYCNTDREIRKALQERGFHLQYEYQEKNSLAILWEES